MHQYMLAMNICLQCDRLEYATQYKAMATKLIGLYYTVQSYGDKVNWFDVVNKHSNPLLPISLSTGKDGGTIIP